MGVLARYIEADIARLSTVVVLVGRVLTTGSLYSAGLPTGASASGDTTPTSSVVQRAAERRPDRRGKEKAA